MAGLAALLAAAGPSPLPGKEVLGLAGRIYGPVRARLLALGDRPVPSRDRADSCSGAQADCRLFPELIGCSYDTPRRCRFAWIDRREMRFEVVTLGEDARRLVVEGLSGP